jgi:hypothetical protein
MFSITKTVEISKGRLKRVFSISTYSFVQQALHPSD